MGYIKEPVGVDLNIGPMPLSSEDRQVVSAIIAHYKNTGEIPKFVRKARTARKRKSTAVTGPKQARTSRTAITKKPPTTSESHK